MRLAVVASLREEDRRRALDDFRPGKPMNGRALVLAALLRRDAFPGPGKHRNLEVYWGESESTCAVRSIRTGPPSTP